jgi:hypothetical protein
MQPTTHNERRSKYRFEMKRDLRYKVTQDGVQVAAGSGTTMNLGSGGVAFSTEKPPARDSIIELSIHWPVLLDDSCPMRLIVFGRILRTGPHNAICSIDKYEFRTAARSIEVVPAPRMDGRLQRFAEGLRKASPKESVVRKQLVFGRVSLAQV